jgi:integrase
MSIIFPKKITTQGVSVTIGRVQKGGRDFFRVLYREQGKRKQAWRSTYKAAKAAADNAIDATLTGDSSALKLQASDRHTYLRAVEILQPFGIPLDVAARECADLRAMLGGRTTPAEACRDWLKRNAVELPRVTVPAAVEKLKKHAETDGKSNDRQKQLAAALDAFAIAFKQEVHTLTPKLIAEYLTALPFRERTKRNHRDTIGFFNRWLVTRGYLAKGTDWLDGVQNYTARKLGEISIYTAEEMRRLIAGADARILPLIVIGGFAGLRHAEIARLDWQDIDLDEGFIEVQAQHAKTEMRRIVPLKANLKAFLLPMAKKSGKVITVVNTTKQLLKAAAATGDEANEIEPLEWKHNALRHTYISARVAECSDVPRVADEAGNSPQVIRSNYLKRIRPTAAAEWFSITPDNIKTSSLQKQMTAGAPQA